MTRRIWSWNIHCMCIARLINLICRLICMFLIKVLYIYIYICALHMSNWIVPMINTEWVKRKISWKAGNGKYWKNDYAIEKVKKKKRSYIKNESSEIACCSQKIIYLCIKRGLPLPLSLSFSSTPTKNSFAKQTQPEK